MRHESYFLKYMPVNEKPEKNDIVIHKQTGKLNEAYWILEHKDQFDIEEYSKVVLFLCTTDIKDGDTIENIYDPTPGAKWVKTYTDLDRVGDNDGVVEWKDVSFSDNPDEQLFRTHTRYEHWFKPLGRLHPEVTWLGDKDRVAEDDWKEVEFDGVKLIDIKCPTCKKFH